MSAPPRLGFVGLGWIGTLRLEAVADSGAAVIAALCDPDPERLEAASRAHPGALAVTSFDRLLERAGDLALDAVVLATPNAFHATHAEAAFDAGLAVFCQKPLGRTADEVRQVVEAARRADRLLEVDYSYRCTTAARTIRQLVADGTLGRVRYIDSVFHNGYGPGKAWCLDPEQGGGALLDLGVHQVDLALWLLGFPPVEDARGRVLRREDDATPAGVDDFGLVELRLAGGTTVRVAVSWEAHVGADAVIRTSIFGSAGGAEMRNVNGGFLDFEVLRFTGRQATRHGRESREWMDRGIVEWAHRLARHPGYDPAIETSVTVAEILDAAYGRTPIPHE